MIYTVEFRCGGNKCQTEVEALSEREAIDKAKTYVYYSVSYANGHDYRVISKREKNTSQNF